MDYLKTLNIGAGKLDFTESIKRIRREKVDPVNLTINLDRSYSEGSSITELEEAWMNIPTNVTTVNHNKFCNMDIFEFMDSWKYRFDHVIAYRIFEHMEYCSGEIGRLLEAINMCTVPKGTVDIIVPNAVALSNMLLEYEAHDTLENDTTLIINSENNNIKLDPHASTWSPKLARQYIGQEGMWDIDTITEYYPYMGRDIYMRIQMKKKSPKEQEIE